MQEHHGKKLKEKIRKSSLKVSELVEKSGTPISSLYDMYKKPELLRSKVIPILKVLKIHPDDFFAGNNIVNDDGPDRGTKTEVPSLPDLKKQLAMQEKMIALLEKSISLQQETISILKKKTK